MNIIKYTAVFCLSLLFLVVTAPTLYAKDHHHYHHHKHKYRSSAFALNLNLDARPAPRYVEYGYVERVVRPTYYESATVVSPYAPVYQERIYTPYQTTIVERPLVERVYVQPHYSYWGY